MQRVQRFWIAGIWWLTDHGAALPDGDILHLAKTLLLELRVAHGEHLVHDKDLRLEVGRHREGEPHIHAAAVALHRRVEKPVDLGEGHDLIELAFDLQPAHPKDRAVEEDVLAAGEFRVEAGAHLQQAGHPTAQADAAGGGLGNAAEQLEKGGLARAVAADDADHLAALDFQAEIPQRPELLGFAALLAGLRTQPSERCTHRLFEHVAQAVALGRLTADLVKF